MTKEKMNAREGLDPDKDPEVDMDLPEDPAADPEPGSDEETGVGSEAEEEPGTDDAAGIQEDEGGDAGGGGPAAQAELESVQDELFRLRDRHLRLAADFENHRKRASTELAGVWGRAQAELVRSLVEGLDDLQRVSRFTSDDTTVDALIEGVDLVERNLLKALTEAGLEVLSPEGERFDPNRMEAMMRVPTEEDGQDETVHQVFQKGYIFKDQLVRPARVSVYMDED
jgi:molecular chaperone GrpE